MLRRVSRQVALGPSQQRTATHHVPARVMVESHSDLNKSLKKLALRLGRGAPDILQNFVGFKELGGIKEFDAVM